MLSWSERYEHDIEPPRWLAFTIAAALVILSAIILHT